MLCSVGDRASGVNMRSSTTTLPSVRTRGPEAGGPLGKAASDGDTASTPACVQCSVGLWGCEGATAGVCDAVACVATLTSPSTATSWCGADADAAGCTVLATACAGVRSVSCETRDECASEAAGFRCSVACGLAGTCGRLSAPPNASTAASWMSPRFVSPNTTGRRRLVVGSWCLRVVEMLRRACCNDRSPVSNSPCGLMATRWRWSGRTICLAGPRSPGMLFRLAAPMKRRLAAIRGSLRMRSSVPRPEGTWMGAGRGANGSMFGRATLCDANDS